MRWGDRMLRSGRLQRLGDLPQGAVAGPAGTAALHIADRADAQPGPLGELLLGQPRRRPVPAQLLAESAASICGIAHLHRRL